MQEDRFYIKNTNKKYIYNIKEIIKIQTDPNGTGLKKDKISFELNLESVFNSMRSSKLIVELTK